MGGPVSVMKSLKCRKGAVDWGSSCKSVVVHCGACFVMLVGEGRGLGLIL